MNRYLKKAINITVIGILFLSVIIYNQIDKSEAMLRLDKSEKLVVDFKLFADSILNSQNDSILTLSNKVSSLKAQLEECGK